MKICVVIQSDAFRSSAGMRIRYDRFARYLPDDVAFEALTTEELLAASVFDHDVYVFCKTFDVSALLLARRLRAAGKVIGQDVFDDYFSQQGDTRLRKYRDWMRDMAPVTDFVICSTPRMAHVLREYFPDIRVTAVGDPASSFDSSAVGETADSKIERARETRSVRVVWFGIGDNPFFAVGLSDLAACEAQLALARRLGWTVSLRIVTNRRPFESSSAELLRTLSIPYELVEWSEEDEAEAIAEATVALLPVNGQSFSRAKSLNRALTALQGGCQVLSPAYPLYSQLHELVYDSCEELLADIGTRSCRLRSATSQVLAETISKLADPSQASRTFVAEAGRAMERVRGRQKQEQLVCLIHGRGSGIKLHKIVSKQGGLSIGTLFTKQGWNVPVRFDRQGNSLIMRVTPAISRRFSIPIRDDASPLRIVDFEFVEVDLVKLGIEPLPLYSADISTAADVALSEAVFSFVMKCCAAALGDVDILVSEAPPLLTPRRKRRYSPSTTKHHGSESRVLPIRRASISPLVSKLTRRLGRPRSHAVMDMAVSKLKECPLFNSEWYRKAYPDVGSQDIQPERHYLELGWLEGRDPSPEFSTKLYLKDHPDVAQQGINPLFHYIEFGQYEGRRFRAGIARKRTSA